MAASESPTRRSALHGGPDQKDPYTISPEFDDEAHEHHVVNDKLARSLTARQVQMIAIGMLNLTFK